MGIINFIFYDAQGNYQERKEGRLVRTSQQIYWLRISLQEDAKKLQNRWKHPASKEPDQIRQMAKVRENPETKESAFHETQEPTSPQHLHPHHREEPTGPTHEAPWQVLPRNHQAEEAKTPDRG